jgi:hypothetical protein
LLATAGSDGALRVWDFRKQKLRAELPLGSGEPSSCTCLQLLSEVKLQA